MLPVSETGTPLPRCYRYATIFFALRWNEGTRPEPLTGGGGNADPRGYDGARGSWGDHRFVARPFCWYERRSANQFRDLISIHPGCVRPVKASTHYRAAARVVVSAEKA